MVRVLLYPVVYAVHNRARIRVAIALTVKIFIETRGKRLQLLVPTAIYCFSFL